MHIHEECLWSIKCFVIGSKVTYSKESGVEGQSRN